MAGSGKISVELRLVLDKLNQDIRNASASMKAGLSKDIGATAAGTDKAASAMDKLGKKVRETTSAINDQKKAMMDAWRESLPKMRVTDTTTRRSRATRFYKPWSTDAGGGLATSPSEMGPTPPIIPPPVIASQTTAMGRFFQSIRQNSAVTSAGSAFAGRFGLSGAGTALRAGPIGIAIAAVVTGLLSLRKALNETFQAMDAARRTYTNAVRAGAPIGFQVARGNIAQALGVSESEVFRFGRAIGFMGDRLSNATKTLTETNAVLTSAAISVRILKINFSAFKAVIAAQVAPAIAQLAAVLSSVFEVLQRTDVAKTIGQLLANAFHQLKFAAIGLTASLMTSVVGVQLLIDSFEWLFSRNRSQDFFKESREGRQALGDMIKGLMAGNVPNAVASTNRLQASAWERMGLVVGAGPGTNYQRDIARYTKATAQGVAALAGLVPRSGENVLPVFSAP